MRHLPNALTILRMLLVIPIAWALWEQSFSLALPLVALAGLTDGLDGWLARRYGWQSRFGEVADPASDKMLTTVVFVLLAVGGHLPAWLALVVVARDLIIVCGALAYRRLFGPFVHQASLIGKVSTGLQIALVLSVLIRLGLPGVESWLGWQWVAVLLEYSVLAAVFASGANYVWTWSRKALRQHDEPAAS